MSEWPEPTPEPGETPRWLAWGVAAIVVGAALWATREENRAQSSADWRLPEITLPEIDWPEFSSGEQADPQTQSAITQETVDSVPGLPPVAPDFNMPVVQGVPFETCVATIDNAPNTLGPPIILENSADRRVARFKLLDGDVTMTCSRADGTMSIERREG